MKSPSSAYFQPRRDADTTTEYYTSMKVHAGRQIMPDGAPRAYWDSQEHVGQLALSDRDVLLVAKLLHATEHAGRWRSPAMSLWLLAGLTLNVAPV